MEMSFSNTSKYQYIPKHESITYLIVMCRKYESWKTAVISL